MPLPTAPVWATNFAPGQFDTAAAMNTVGTNGTFLTAPPLFKGYQSAAQSLANGTVTAIAIDTTVTDLYGGHSNVTNNSRYTVQAGTAGFYLVGVSVGMVANATGDRVIEIHKNGVVDKLSQFNMIAPTAGVAVVSQAWTVLQLAVGDYVEGYYYQTSGAARNSVPDQTGMTVLWIHS